MGISTDPACSSSIQHCRRWTAVTAAKLGHDTTRCRHFSHGFSPECSFLGQYILQHSRPHALLYPGDPICNRLPPRVTEFDHLPHACPGICRVEWPRSFYAEPIRVHQGLSEPLDVRWTRLQYPAVHVSKAN